MNDGRLDAYLDGRLSRDEADEFEKQLRANDAQRAEVDLQRQLDSALRRRFAPPDLARQLFDAVFVEKEQPARAEHLAPAHAGRKRHWLWTVAMGLSIVAAGIICLSWPRTKAPQHAQITLTQIYVSSIRSGYRPILHGKDNHRIAAVFKERQGQPLVVEPLPEGSTLLGLSYCGGFSPLTTTVVCKVDGQLVMVFVDRAELENAINHPPNRKARIYRRILGDLVLYEVSPYGQPRVLDRIKLPSTIRPAELSDDEQEGSPE